MKKLLGAQISYLLVLLLLSPVVSSAADTKPVAVKKEDKCRVCGMFVSKYKEWIAEIIFKDGSYAAFDGPKDMFKYYFDLPRYNPSKKTSDIQEVYVTEYYSAKLMNAKNLYFVSGSDVYGPMGHELVPVETEALAKEFMRDHGGRKIRKFSEITKEDLN